MPDITAQQLADAIATAVYEEREPDAPARITVREGLHQFEVRGEFDIEMAAAVLNDMLKKEAYSSD